MNRKFIVAVLLAMLIACPGSGRTDGKSTGNEITLAIPVADTVTLVDLGAKTCIPCKMMAPILEELKTEYRGRAEVIFLDVREQPEAAIPFKVSIIPTQILYDRQGREVFRHVGFLDKKGLQRQLEKYLWPEVHKWARAIKWDKIGRAPFDINELFTKTLRLQTGEAFAVASDNPALIEGAHADFILYIFDESKSVIPATFDPAEGALTTRGAIAVAMSTPGEPHGRFYDIQSKKQGYQDWWTRHVTKEEVIAAGRMSETWAEDRKTQWGETSAVYLNRVEGQFASSDEESVISLAAVERANERWQEISDAGKWGDFICVAVDVARTGVNKTVQALRYTFGIKDLKRSSKEDTMQTAGRVEGTMRSLDGPAIIDVIGIGAGVFDRLRELGLEVIPFNASARTNFMGTTGTKASYLELFKGEHAKVRELERKIAERLGIPRVYPVTGQTYSRKGDSQVLDLLSGIAQSAAKMATDLRLLQHEDELLEPFEQGQIGSSAMAYKRNPMRAERICGLARFVISLQANTAHTAATQWLERTLDDSANRRLTLPESFLATDAILVLAENIAAGLEVRPEAMARHVRDQANASWTCL